MTPTPFDAITLEVLWTRIISVVDEAAKAIVRTSFSTLSNEANDFACVLTDARGFALAQNSGSIPSFIGTLPATVRHFLNGIGAQNMRPGDVLITNDPWQGTGHMSDVCLVKPIFLLKEGTGSQPILVAFAATTSHMPDIGGRIRAIEARELFEEGFHIPLTHLIRAGQVDETLLGLLRANVRTPDQTVGDIWAQVSANELMENRVRRLMEEYGLDSLEGLADELFARSERAMRDAIRIVPDGTYRYGIETDGFEAPYRFRVALTVRGDEILADFTGTSPAQPRAINCVLAYTYAMTAYAVRCALLPGLPNNEGMYRPVKVEAPEGCLLNPKFPAAVVSRAQTGHYVPILILGALHQVIPERVAAAAGSPLWAVAQSGVRDDGRPYTTVLFFNGGMGATAGKDGEHVLSWPSNISSTPVEVAERNSPLFFHYKRMRSGSGGRGRFRGGLGQDMLIESESRRPIVVSFMAERTRFPAPGLAGGGAGGLGDVRINGRKVDHRRQHVLERGDRVLVSTPGGQVVPARNLLAVGREAGPVQIDRKNMERITRVNADIETSLSEAIAAVESRLSQVRVPPDFAIGFGAEVEEQARSFRQLQLVLILAVLLVYAVMASQYESLRDPFIIMFSIPVAGIGVVGSLLLTGTSFSMQAYIGVIMLAGIVVSNAILLVDYINTLRRRDGVPLREAVEVGGRRRLRPILMTSIATMLGLVPMAIGLGDGGELQAPLARVVIGGLLASTMVTLVLVPAVYTLFEEGWAGLRKGASHS